METIQNINIGIRKIRETEFFADDSITLSSDSAINFSFQLDTLVRAESKELEMVLTVFYIVDEKQFLRMKTTNIFHIVEMDLLYEKEANSYNIPDNVLATMLGLSITHTRALLAKASLGTKFADIYIPIVNPTELMRNMTLNLQQG